MIVASPEKSALYRERGWWGDATLGDMFVANAKKNPDRLALVDAPNRADIAFGEPQRFTYAALSGVVDDLAARLLAAGLGKDDILLVQMPNISELVALYMACARIGVIISPVPVQYREHELGGIIAKLKPAAFVCCTQVHGANHVGIAQELLSEETPLMTFGPRTPEGAIDFSSFQPIEDASGRIEELVLSSPLSADDIFTICWTSGTTGKPKGVPRSHNHWIAIGPTTHQAAGLRDGDILLNPFPLINMASIGGITMSWLISAGTMVLHHPFDPQVYLTQIATEKPAFTVAPPAILNMLLQNEVLLATCDLSSLRVIGSGSAPLSPAMVKGFEDRFGIIVINLFGSNEGMSLVSDGEAVPDPEERASYFTRERMFTPLHGSHETSSIATRLVDPDGGNIISETGVTGELHISGPTVFEGYFEAPEQTADAFTEDGWFRTGDLFQMAGEGRFLEFVGRSKDLIIRGGVNIAPEEIDQLLAGHPDLVEACAFAIPDAILGERVGLAAVPKAGIELDLAGITNFLRAANIAVFKLPEKLFIVDALPRNALNKVNRIEVRENALAEIETES